MRVLSFRMQPQQNTMWCWAAVSASISRFYKSHSTWTQCRIVCNGLGDIRCCDHVTIPACNKAWALDKALRITGNLYLHFSSSINFDQIVQQINYNKIVGVRIQWAGGRGHFIAIIGYYSLLGEDYYFVEDPRPKSAKKSLIKEDRLKFNYQTAGSWTDTYITKATQEDMIKIRYIDRKLLGRANKIAGVMFPKRRNRLFANLSKRELYQTSHFVYNIPFGSIKSKENKLNRTSYRIVDWQDLVIFDVSENTEDAVIREIIFDKFYVKQYLRSFMNLFEMGLSKTDSYEVAFTIQAELNHFAFCLINSNEIKSDNIYLIFDPELPQDVSFYSERQYFSILLDLAENFDSYDSNFGG